MNADGKFLCLMLVIFLGALATLHTVRNKYPDFFKDSRRVSGQELDELKNRALEIEKRMDRLQAICGST